MATPDYSTDIGLNSQSPASAGADGMTAAQQPIEAQISADRYVKAVAGVKNKRRGLRFSKMIPAGPVSDQQTNAQGGISNFDVPGGLI